MMMMDNDTLSDRWGSIARALCTVMKKFDKLPEEEQDQDFCDWIERAYLHAEKREDALIDPS